MASAGAFAALGLDGRVAGLLLKYQNKGDKDRDASKGDIDSFEGDMDIEM